MKKYKVIYADPPWPLNRSKTMNRLNLKRGLRLASKRLRPDLSDYALMGLSEIKNLPVRNIVADDAVLFLWVINGMIPRAYEVAESWGFKPKHLLVWHKGKRGFPFPQYSFIGNAEYLLFASRGKWLEPAQRQDSVVFTVKRSGGHSSKPKEFREMIERMYPGLSYVELFARERPTGWDVWGDEVKSDIIL